MKILLTHVYSKENRGDAAIVATMIEQLRTEIPAASLALVAMDVAEATHQFVGVQQVQSFFGWAVYASQNQLLRIFRTLFVVLVTVLWSLAYRLTGMCIRRVVPRELFVTLQEYARADLILPVGGGYLVGKNTLHDTVSIILQLHAIVVAQVMRKRVILFSQSVGPFGNWLQRLAVRTILRRVEIVLSRENLSTRNLHALGVPVEKVIVSADAAFLFTPPTDSDIFTRLKLPTTYPYVGITVRQWLEPEQQSAYEQTIASFALVLVQKGYTVLFVPQVTSQVHNDDDTVVHERIVKLLPPDTRGVHFLPTHLSFTEVRSIFAGCQFVVGTRMHSALFALTALVPSLAIAYERKTIGVMQDMGLADYVIQIEQITVTSLSRVFDQLEQQRGKYLEILEKSLPKQQELARVGFAIVKNSLSK